MIIKGNSRGGASQLARHLLRADTNERIKIIELQSPLEDLNDTLRDWQLLSTGTQGKKGLYHANINPADYAMTPEQWIRSVDILEKELGFTGQPRAIVLHEKEGREHIHVVWQRTDIDTMTLKSDSQNYQAHERASMTLEQEFGHEMVPGKHAKRDRQKQPDFPRSETNHDEWQQAQRAGIDPKEFKAKIKELHQQSDSAQAFRTALEQHGLMLARGDRGYTLVDQQGCIYNLARQLKQHRSEVDRFMAAIPLATLPIVEKAQALQEAERILKEHPPAPAPKPTQPEPDDPTVSHVHMSTEEQRRLEDALKERHAGELYWIQQRQKAELQQIVDVFRQERNDKLRDRRALRMAELERFIRREKEYSDNWIRKIFDIMRNRWNPAIAEQKRLERQRQVDEIRTRHRIERDTLIQNLRMQRDQDLEDLKHRHAEQQQKHADQYKADLQRHREEKEDLQKLIAKMEEQNRQEALNKKPDEPDPPKPSL